MVIIENYKLAKENDYGNIEYKREILNLKRLKYKYSTQMIYRLNEGKGIAYYYLGVNDDGSFYDWDKETKKKSLQNLIEIVNLLDANIVYVIEFNSGYKVKIRSIEYKNDFII